MFLFHKEQFVFPAFAGFERVDALATPDYGYQPMTNGSTSVAALDAAFVTRLYVDDATMRGL